MSNQRSGGHKAQLSEYIPIDGLNKKIQQTIASYLTTMHNLSEGTKEGNLARLSRLAIFLIKRGYTSFEDADKEAVDGFLSGMKSQK
jgi:hypothetical protein